MLLKILTDLYFDNRVQVIPAGAISFFGYLAELEKILKEPGLMELKEIDIVPIVADAEKVTIVALERARDEQLGLIIKDLEKQIPGDVGKRYKSAFFHIIGDQEMTLFEVNEVAESVFSFLNEEANVQLGAAVDSKMNKCVRLLLVLVE